MGSATGVFMLAVKDTEIHILRQCSHSCSTSFEDPDELHDLGADPNYADVRCQMEANLRSEYVTQKPLMLRLRPIRRLL